MTIQLFNSRTNGVPAGSLLNNKSGVAEVGNITAQLTVIGSGLVGGQLVLRGTLDRVRADQILTIDVPASAGGTTVVAATDEKYFVDEFWWDFVPAGGGTITELYVTVRGSGV